MLHVVDGDNDDSEDEEQKALRTNAEVEMLRWIRPWNLISSAVLNASLSALQVYHALTACISRDKQGASPGRNAFTSVLSCGKYLQPYVARQRDPTLIRRPFLELISTRPYTLIRREGPVPRSFVLEDAGCKQIATHRWLLYLHGGGLVSGTVYDFEAFCGELCRRLECQTLFVDYRLAPEHQLDDAFDDTCACFDWLRKEAEKRCVSRDSPLEVTLVADSAGALLALKLLLKHQSDSLLRSAVLLSPILDLTFTGESFASEANDDDVLDTTLLSQLLLSALLPGADPAEPCNSPLFGLSKDTTLPPLMLVVAEHELLRDDSVRAVARLAGCSEEEARNNASGPGLPVPVEARLVLDIDENGFHDYPLYHDHVEESEAALHRFVVFIQRHWREP